MKAKEIWIIMSEMTGADDVAGSAGLSPRRSPTLQWSRQRRRGPASPQAGWGPSPWSVHWPGLHIRLIRLQVRPHGGGCQLREQITYLINNVRTCDLSDKTRPMVLPVQCQALLSTRLYVGIRYRYSIFISTWPLWLNLLKIMGCW